MNRLVKILLRTLLVIFIIVNIITAFHAYKITHFYDVGEITLKSRYETTGAEKIKAIFFGINAVKQRNDAVTDTSLQAVYLTTKENIQLACWYIPVAAPAKGTVLLFHGHGSTKSAVIQEAEAFRKIGYHVLLTDFRAHGNSGGNTCTVGYYEAEDIKLSFGFIKAKGEKNIVLWGISMGAAAITKAMNDYNLEVSKIILEMPFGSILYAAEGRLKIMGLPKEPLAVLVTFWSGAEHGFWAFKMKPAEFAKKIPVPVLLQWGRNDPRVMQQEIDMI